VERLRAAHTGTMQEEHDRPGAGGVADPPTDRRPEDPPPPDEGAGPATGEQDRVPVAPGTAGSAMAVAPVAPVVVPRWIQLVVLPLAILGAWALLRAAGPITLLFVVAALIALLLNPFVALLQRRRVPRGLAVLVVYLALVVALVGLGSVLAGPIGDQASTFGDNVPEIIDDANAELADLQRWLDGQGVDVEVQAQGRTALATLGERVSAGSGELVTFTRDALTILVEASIALILIVVLSVYMLLYGQRIGAAVRGVVPRGDGTPRDDYPTAVQGAVFGYVRGQLLFSTIMGTSAGIALWIMGSLGVFPEGKTYAVVFGAWYGFAELIPYVGPAIGAAPPVLLSLVSGDPLDALWLTIMFTALQQIEGHVVAPTVFSQALRINPLLVIFALLIGGRLYGFAGAFIALPIAAVLRETVVYLRRHLVLEPWGPGSAFAGAGTGAAAGPAPPGTRCAECGATAPAGAAFCPSCGADLDETDAAAVAAAPS
jgi:predicted PurR-regulated permease PerM